MGHGANQELNVVGRGFVRIDKQGRPILHDSSFSDNGSHLSEVKVVSVFHQIHCLVSSSSNLSHIVIVHEGTRADGFGDIMSISGYAEEKSLRVGCQSAGVQLPRAAAFTPLGTLFRLSSPGLDVYGGCDVGKP